MQRGFHTHFLPQFAFIRLNHHFQRTSGSQSIASRCRGQVLHYNKNRLFPAALTMLNLAPIAYQTSIRSYYFRSSLVVKNSIGICPRLFLADQDGCKRSQTSRMMRKSCAQNIKRTFQGFKKLLNRLQPFKNKHN